ncbi:MAG: hypothetical protein ACE5HO_13005 [bacterium]
MKPQIKVSDVVVKKIAVCLLALAVLFAGRRLSYAQGGTAGAFLRVGIGARAKAMGDAYTALAKGIEASYYNPAGLPFLQHKELMTSLRVLSLDRQFTFVGLAVPIRPKSKNKKSVMDGGFSLSWIHAGVGDIDGRDSNGQPLGDFSNSENAFVFSFALSPAKVLSFGLSVKYLLNRFPDVGTDGKTISATGVGLDFGGLLSPFDWLTLGISVKDINSKYTWNTKDLFGDRGSQVINEFPTRVRSALAVRVPHVQGLTVALDYEDSKELDSKVHFGAEKVLQQDFVVRAGIDDGALTAGGAYLFELFGKMSQLNYAFASSGNRPESEHVFSWVFQF